MAACECGACGLRFTSVTAFDQHQTTNYGTTHPVICHDPDTRGLVKNRRGIWAWPSQNASGRPRVKNLRPATAEPGHVD